MHSIDIIEGHIEFKASPSFHRVETQYGYHLMSCSMRTLGGSEKLSRITNARTDNEMCKLTLINQRTLENESYNIHSGYVETTDEGDILHLEIMVYE